ncbi:hypothetical protein M514_08477 [Trichuris suis]|uniref:Uncharacterized protein n=1 Tax=Trichuris suis TaxID=68888 RepID=A0A085MWI6_9BILA|nr:hypothetical protein M513_08477 [Trichuris suis]KFD61582.1 hypothetical protein M514_08477 [Trichuris suis]
MDRSIVEDWISADDTTAAVCHYSDLKIVQVTAGGKKGQSGDDSDFKNEKNAAKGVTFKILNVQKSERSIP